jgi:hypothetical protein
MDIATIIAELEAERDRLDSAIAALQGNKTTTKPADQMAGDGTCRQQLAGRSVWL